MPFVKPLEQPVNTTVHIYGASNGQPLPSPQVVQQPPLPSPAPPATNHVVRKSGARIGFLLLGIWFVLSAVGGAFISSFAIINSSTTGGVKLEGFLFTPFFVASTVFLGIIGIMFLVLVPSPKGQPYLRGNRGLKKSTFVVICLIVAFVASATLATFSFLWLVFW